jgi:hypothetical protein
MARRPALLAAVVAVLAVAATSASAGVSGKKTGQSRDEVVGYWTDARINSAVPKELAKPGSAGGGGPTKPGASIAVADPYPSQHGKVFFTENGVNYVCSGSAVSQPGGDRSIVWTAGHCLNEGPGDFVVNFIFVPAYKDNVRPHGTFAASTLYTTSGWQNNGELGVDLGAAVVGENAAGQTLHEATNELTPSFYSDYTSAFQDYDMFGYPAAGKFNGQRLRLCDTKGSRLDTFKTPDTVGSACDMTGGSSGGGWVTNLGTIASVTSYSIPGIKNVLFGPHQESDAQTLFNTAYGAATPDDTP